MLVQYKGILTLVKNALQDTPENPPKEFDLCEAVSVVKAHHLTGLVYNGALKCGYSPSEDVMVKLMSHYMKLIMQSENQLYEISNILSSFEQNRIDCMPLKGTLLKMMYPKPDMREMSDSDILIKKHQFEEINKTMTSLGFEFKTESDHEYIYKKGMVSVEFHTNLIPSYNRDMHAYYENIWEKANKTSGKNYIYEMTPENNYIYNFVHMAKHYRDGGVGVKHFVDLWMVEQKGGSLDKGYIIGELKKMSLDKFYENIIDTVDVWFNGKEDTAVTDFITENVFEGGAYGSFEKKRIAAETIVEDGASSEKNKYLSRVFKKIFPSYEDMCYGYPVLKKAPVLLPVMWVYRALLFSFLPQKRKQMKKTINLISIESISTYKESLEYVGLDLDSKNKIIGD